MEVQSIPPIPRRSFEIENFRYEIGRVSTDVYWQPPTYDLIKAYLSDSEVHSVIKKYDGAFIQGGVLWDIDNTWDLDLYLLKPFDQLNYDEVEDDLDTLNRVALHKYRLLVDCTVQENPFIPPFDLKQQMIEQNKDVEILEKFEYRHEPTKIICISHEVKTVNNYQYIKDWVQTGRTIQKLTDNYLIQCESSIKLSKIVHKVINGSVDCPILHLSVKEFLLMDETHFKKIQNR